MRDPLFLHQMDERFGRGCGNPFCTHTHTDGLFLIALCHQGTDLRVDYAPDRPFGAVLRLHCRRGRALAIEIALLERVALTPTCRHGRTLEVPYQHGSVTVMCRRCHAVQATADVAAYVPPEGAIACESLLQSSRPIPGMAP